MSSLQRVVSISLVALALAARSVGAQQCAAQAHPLFDFQVERGAVFIVDTTVNLRPAVGAFTPIRPSAVVKFVVDTLGNVDSTTFELLVLRNNAMADSIRAVLHLWHYRPASIGQCKVPELIQAIIPA